MGNRVPPYCGRSLVIPFKTLHTQVKELVPENFLLRFWHNGASALLLEGANLGINTGQRVYAESVMDVV